jgi:hypothetical protein
MGFEPTSVFLERHEFRAEAPRDVVDTGGDEAAPGMAGLIEGRGLADGYGAAIVAQHTAQDLEDDGMRRYGLLRVILR